MIGQETRFIEPFCNNMAVPETNNWRSKEENYVQEQLHDFTLQLHRFTIREECSTVSSFFL